jgi:hypothetical protein
MCKYEEAGILSLEDVQKYPFCLAMMRLKKLKRRFILQLYWFLVLLLGLLDVESCKYKIIKVTNFAERGCWFCL